MVLQHIQIVCDFGLCCCLHTITVSDIVTVMYSWLVIVLAMTVAALRVASTCVCSAPVNIAEIELSQAAASLLGELRTGVQSLSKHPLDSAGRSLVLVRCSI